ncbi:MazG-like family protein [Halosegnis marinus]
MAISVEANELLETFLWFDNPDSATVASDDETMRAVEEELADVIIYALGLANELDIDILAAVEAKLDENDERFDPETSEAITAELDKWQR